MIAADADYERALYQVSDSGSPFKRKRERVWVTVSPLQSSKRPLQRLVRDWLAGARRSQPTLVTFADNVNCWLPLAQGLSDEFALRFATAGRALEAVALARHWPLQGDSNVLATPLGSAYEIALRVGESLVHAFATTNALSATSLAAMLVRSFGTSGAARRGRNRQHPPLIPAVCAQEDRAAMQYFLGLQLGLMTTGWVSDETPTGIKLRLLGWPIGRTWTLRRKR